MLIPNPSPEVVTAVNAAAEWLKANADHGYTYAAYGLTTAGGAADLGAALRDRGPNAIISESRRHQALRLEQAHRSPARLRLVHQSAGGNPAALIREMVARTFGDYERHPETQEREGEVKSRGDGRSRREFIREISLGAGAAVLVPGALSGCARALGRATTSASAAATGWDHGARHPATHRAADVSPIARLRHPQYGRAMARDRAGMAHSAPRHLPPRCAGRRRGRVVVPAGQYVTGPIHLKSNVNLHVARGATLAFSRDPRLYLPAVLTRFEGTELMNYSPLIYALDQREHRRHRRAARSTARRRRALVAVEGPTNNSAGRGGPTTTGRRGCGSSTWQRRVCRSPSASSARATTCGRSSSSPTAARTCSSKASRSATRRCGRSTRCSARTSRCAA